MKIIQLKIKQKKHQQPLITRNRNYNSYKSNSKTIKLRKLETTSRLKETTLISTTTCIIP